MQHDTLNRELIFSHKEMIILGLEFSPQPDRVAANLLRVAEKAGKLCAEELGHIYVGSEFDSARNQFDPAALRGDSELADTLALQLAGARDFVLAVAPVLPKN